MQPTTLPELRYRHIQCECGRRLTSSSATYLEMTCICGRVNDLSTAELGEMVPPRDCGGPIVIEDNPAWVAIVRRLRKPEDAGIGDTVARLLGRFGERFKAWSKRLGIPCGCTARQAEWNRRWPY